MSAKSACQPTKLGFAPERLGSSEIGRIVAAAAWHSTRAGRLWGLHAQDQGDLHQDIVVDVLTRLHRFNPGKSPFGAFIDLLAGRAASRVISRYLNPVSIKPLWEQQAPSESGGDGEPSAIRRLVLGRLLAASADPTIGRLFADGLELGPDPPVASSVTRWRRRRTLRLLLLLHGIDRPP